MQLAGRLEMRDPARIEALLDSEHIGRICTLDADGFPQVIPMNFARVGSAIYMHSHTRGEKLDNIRRDARAGFEVDREFEFLPSYFEDEHDASLADTLYASVVIKGRASIVEDPGEKATALNALMAKYQPEGRYDPVRRTDDVMRAVAVIKIAPSSVRGKYKIGQHLGAEARARLAAQIRRRGSPTARSTLEVMGFDWGDPPRMIAEPRW